MNQDDFLTQEIVKNMPKGAMFFPTILDGTKQVAFFIKDSKDFLEKVSNPIFEIRVSIMETFVEAKKVIMGVIYLDIYAVDGQLTTYEMFVNVCDEMYYYVFKQFSRQEKLYFYLFALDGKRVGNGFGSKSPAFIKEFIEKLLADKLPIPRWTMDDFNLAKENYIKAAPMEELVGHRRLMRGMN